MWSDPSPEVEPAQHRYGRIVSDGAVPPSRHELDGLSIRDQLGDGSDPPVVIVHGGMDRSSSFGRMIRLLPNVPIRRYDRRGYGGSQPGVAVDLDRHVDDLLTVIGPRPAAVFGHSIGGTIAVAAAARHPQRFAAIGVYESPVPWIGPKRPSRSTTLLHLEPAEAAEQFMVTMVGERIWRRLPASSREDRRREGPALLADMRIADGTARFDPASVRVPVLIAAGGGEDDDRRREARALADALPDAELVSIEGAIHGIHLGDPAAAARLVDRLRGRAV